MKIVLASLLISQALPAQTQQFGLDCAIAYPASGRTSNIKFSIDLEAGRWCWIKNDSCWRSEVYPLVSASSTTLILSNKTRIDRTSGSYQDDLAHGRCSKSDFVPLPNAAF